MPCGCAQKQDEVAPTIVFITDMNPNRGAAAQETARKVAQSIDQASIILLQRYEYSFKSREYSCIFAWIVLGDIHVPDMETVLRTPIEPWGL